MNKLDGRVGRKVAYLAAVALALGHLVLASGTAQAEVNERCRSATTRYCSLYWQRDGYTSSTACYNDLIVTCGQDEPPVGDYDCPGGNCVSCTGRLDPNC